MPARPRCGGGSGAISSGFATPSRAGSTAKGPQFSPDGKLLAIDDGPKQTVTLLDAATGSVVRTLPPLSSHVACFAISKDGKRLAAAGHDRTVKVWEINDGHELVTIGPLPGDFVLDLEFTPDGNRLATAGARWNPTQGGLMAEQVRIWEIGPAS